MKAILLSIKPEWLAKILNREKTIEVRKKFPKDYVGWVYLYCTKDKKYANLINRGGFLTGMVVARFWCDKITKYVNGLNWEYAARWAASYDDYKRILEPSCLTEDELYNYVVDLSFFAIHISKLEIFDRPKELGEFYTTKLDEDLTKRFDNSIQLENGTWVKPITKAPQNYCYIGGE